MGQILRRLERDRFEAVRRARGAPAKLATAGRFAPREAEVIVLRHNLERKAIEARHTSRGTIGSWEQKVDLERAQIRRAGAENRIQRREEKCRERLKGWKRPEVRFTRRSDRIFAQGRERLIRAIGRAAIAAGRATATALKSLAQTWVPRGAKALVQVASLTASGSIEMASSLAQCASTAGKALSIAFKATDLAKGLTKTVSTPTKEIER
jgi:hypothetical protein